MTSPITLIRELRDLDPLNEPNTTWHIGQDAANLIEKLLAKIEDLEENGKADLEIIASMQRRMDMD